MAIPVLNFTPADADQTGGLGSGLDKMMQVYQYLKQNSLQNQQMALQNQGLSLNNQKSQDLLPFVTPEAKQALQSAILDNQMQAWKNAHPWVVNTQGQAQQVVSMFSPDFGQQPGNNNTGQPSPAPAQAPAPAPQASNYSPMTGNELTNALIQSATGQQPTQQKSAFSPSDLLTTAQSQDNSVTSPVNTQPSSDSPVPNNLTNQFSSILPPQYSQMALTPNDLKNAHSLMQKLFLQENMSKMAKAFNDIANAKAIPARLLTQNQRDSQAENAKNGDYLDYWTKAANGMSNDQILQSYGEAPGTPGTSTVQTNENRTETNKMKMYNAGQNYITNTATPAVARYADSIAGIPTKSIWTQLMNKDPDGLGESIAARIAMKDNSFSQLQSMGVRPTNYTAQTMISGALRNDPAFANLRITPELYSSVQRHLQNFTNGAYDAMIYAGTGKYPADVYSNAQLVKPPKDPSRTLLSYAPGGRWAWQRPEDEAKNRAKGFITIRRLS